LQCEVVFTVPSLLKSPFHLTFSIARDYRHLQDKYTILFYLSCIYRYWYWLSTYDVEWYTDWNINVEHNWKLSCPT